MALESKYVTSRLVAEMINILNELSSNSRVSLRWTKGTRGDDGK